MQKGEAVIFDINVILHSIYCIFLISRQILNSILPDIIYISQQGTITDNISYYPWKCFR